MAEISPVVGSVVRQSLTDAEIHRSVYETLVGVLLPAIPAEAEWARAAAVQLAGLARYGADRGTDRTEERLAQLVAVLDGLVDNTIVAAAWDGGRDQQAIMAAVGSALAAAVGRGDHDAEQVRSVLRPVVVRHLDDELAETAPLVGAFRGKLEGVEPRG